MPLPPARSPLLPYTTLFRSGSRGGHGEARPNESDGAARPATGAGRGDGHGPAVEPAPVAGRAAPSPSFTSEEHTSELQSLTNHVCRLLLEKNTAMCGLSIYA